MKAFGVQFRFDDRQRFSQLASLFAEIKRDKDAQEFRDPQQWVGLVPDAVKGFFTWPTAAERERWLGVRATTPIWIGSPGSQVGAQWDFFRVFESIEESEYSLVGCEAVGDDVGEMRIEPDSYPYGGVGPFIALAEAFGFEVLGATDDLDAVLGGPAAG